MAHKPSAVRWLANSCQPVKVLNFTDSLVSLRNSTLWLAPALLAVITKLTGSDRYGIISLVVFFLAGIIMLQFVNIERGVKVAEAEDKLLVQLD